MFFSEALRELQAGKSMHRAAWTKESGYLKLMDGMDFVWKIVLIPSPNAGNYIFSVEDFQSDDWKEFSVAVKGKKPSIAKKMSIAKKRN